MPKSLTKKHVDSNFLLRIRLENRGKICPNRSLHSSKHTLHAQQAMVSLKSSHVPGTGLKKKGGKFSWVVVSNMFSVHPYLGKIPNLTSIFFKGVAQPPTSFGMFW